MSHRLDRQKDIYDEKIHCVIFKQNNLVLLHSTVPRGSRRKLHRSWTFKVHQTTRSNSLLPHGTNLSQVPQDDFQLPTPPRYPQQSRHPPPRFHPMLIKDLNPRWIRFSGGSYVTLCSYFILRLVRSDVIAI